MWIGLPDGERYLTEVMETPDERARGLMYRKQMADDRLMLFHYNRDGVYKLWMKNCLFPIDVAWTDRYGQVLAVETALPPCEREPCPVYGPDGVSRYFIEGPTGWLERGGVTPGDHLELGPHTASPP